MKRRIEYLEDQLWQVEKDNDVLRNFNEIFGDESDRLIKENETLKAEVERYRQFRIPPILNPTRDSIERPNKRNKSKV